MRLENKVAIITGGASGIGRAICEVFAEEGARLAVADIDEAGGQETVAKVRAAGGQAIFVPTDVSDEAQVQELVGRTVDAYGTVNVLVNDAAAFEFGKVEDVTDEQWQRVFAVNVIGQAYCVKHVLPYMRLAGGGAIVNIASVSGFIAQPAFVPYNASKGAVMQLTRCLALDLAPDKIRVNCVCPGAILTPATERHRRFEGRDREEFLAEAAGGNFMKRVGDPREIAYGALFLASDEASFVTGTPLVMDGGATAQ
ncbi:MAG: glucose 1-dehydrogenase [Chloroflexi bacterium]|nr:glucose 1-dehydrogenase [Chloroflexota bacterium]